MRFVYLPWTLRPSALQGLLFVFTMSQSPDPKYTLCSDSPTQNTHIHTLVGTYIAYGDTRAPPAARKASSCSTYTHSFPLPTPISSPLNGPWGLELSLRLSRTFSSSCRLFKSLLSIYESPHLLRVHVLITLSAHLFPFPLSQACSPRGRKEKERGSPNPGPGARNGLNEFHYKQARMFHTKDVHRGK